MKTPARLRGSERGRREPEESRSAFQSRDFSDRSRSPAEEPAPQDPGALLDAYLDQRQAHRRAADASVQAIQGKSASESPIEIRKSAIHGEGVHANAAFQPGETVHVGANAQPGKGGKTQWEETRSGRYTNHQGQPNARNVRSGNEMLTAATKSIQPGDEVTVDYSAVRPVIGDGELTWKGEKVPSGKAAAEFFKKRD